MVIICRSNKWARFGCNLFVWVHDSTNYYQQVQKRNDCHASFPFAQISRRIANIPCNCQWIIKKRSKLHWNLPWKIWLGKFTFAKIKTFEQNCQVRWSWSWFGKFRCGKFVGSSERYLKLKARCSTVGADPFIKLTV